MPKKRRKSADRRARRFHSELTVRWFWEPTAAETLEKAPEIVAYMRAREGPSGRMETFRELLIRLIENPGRTKWATARYLAQLDSRESGRRPPPRLAESHARRLLAEYDRWRRDHDAKTLAAIRLESWYPKRTENNVVDDAALSSFYEFIPAQGPLELGATGKGRQGRKKRPPPGTS